MQWLANLPLGDKPAFQIAALLGVAIVAIIVLIVAYRMVFGHRLRFSGGGKARQPRLGLVDAFSLDGQRQLVIVRRDNVEHLLMIGGPNDIVVESQIVRAQPQAPPRDKDVVAAPVASKSPASAPAPTPAQAPVRIVSAPANAAVRPQPGPVAVAAPARAIVRPEPIVSAPSPKVAQPQSQQSQTPAQPNAPTAPAPRAAQGGAEPAESRAPTKPLVLPLRGAASVPTPKPSTLPPPIVVSSAPAAPAGAPSKSLVIAMPSPAPAPAQKPPAAPASQPASNGRDDPFAGLDSLEAEMARLLGRDP
jgi:flagellar protein FliO/FliZ